MAKVSARATSWRRHGNRDYHGYCARIRGTGGKMRWAVRLREEFCLGLWSPTAPEAAHGQKRRLADRSAAERALLEALQLSARSREHSTISLAHKCGAGAALV